MNNKVKKILSTFSTRVKAFLQNDLIAIKLFGSQTRGDTSDSSDIDVLIVIKKRDFKTCDALYKILFELDPYYEQKISLSIFSQEEYLENERLGSFFIENIKKEAIAI